MKQEDVTQPQHIALSLQQLGEAAARYAFMQGLVRPGAYKITVDAESQRIEFTGEIRVPDSGAT